MTVLFRWLFISTLMRIAVITLAIMLIFMMAESIDKAGHLGKGLTLQLLFEYLVLKVPFMISELMPIIVLIGVAVYVLELSHNNELAALRAAGLAFSKLLQPLLAAGVLVGVLMFAVGEWIEPVVNKRLAYIERVHIAKKVALEQGVQWMTEGKRFIRIMPLMPPFFSVLMIQKDNQGLWQERVDASKGYYDQGEWLLENVYVSQANSHGGFTTSFHDTWRVASKLSPKTVATPDPRDMKWMELYAFEKALAAAGLESKAYLFQLQRKLALPLSCLIMVILAYSLCSSMGARAGANVKGVALAISIGLLFYVLGSAIKVYVIGGDLPVVYGVWLPNILFLGVAGYLLLKKEGY